MSKSTIPLSKLYDESRVEYPCYVSEKHDGVPVRIDIMVDGNPSSEDFKSIAWSVRSRQGEDVPSCHTYVEVFIQALLDSGMDMKGNYTFIAEVTHKTLKAFKDVSGVVRRKEPQEDLVFNFFDFVYHDPAAAVTFGRRTRALMGILAPFSLYSDLPFHYVQQTQVHTQVSLKHALSRVYEENPDAEGCIIRSGSATFKPNSRHWDYQKYLIEPTEDCVVIRYEEAHTKDGEPKGMVGAIWVEHKGKEQRVGAGKMTHAERKLEWIKFLDQDQRPVQKRVCEIKHKGDTSYDGLRQGTFQHWRHDKA